LNPQPELRKTPLTFFERIFVSNRKPWLLKHLKAFATERSGTPLDVISLAAILISSGSDFEKPNCLRYSQVF
jgi:hypothetical protein